MRDHQDNSSSETPDGDDITRVLREVYAGQPAALDELMRLVYSDLYQRASRQVAHNPPWRSLSATGLLNEVYLRLFGSGRPMDWANRNHFYMAATRAMRDILVERARFATRLKRGGNRQRIPLTEDVSIERESQQVLNLNESLDRLEASQPRQARVVMLKFFGGLTEKEIAELLEVSPNTVRRDWRLAKMYLARECAPD